MDEIDHLISEKTKRAQALRLELAQVENDLRALRRSRALMRGEPNPDEVARYTHRGRPSLPDLVEEILRSEPIGLYVDDIVARLAELNVHANRQTITSSLTRWIKKGKRFKKIGRNTFALREAG